jgi:hypothetical protein
MPRRALCCALTALALLLPAQAPAATTSYAVSYRKPGADGWTQDRHHRTPEEAASAARALDQKGLEVQVLPRFTMTRLPDRPRTGTLPAGETVTPRQAAEVFRWLAGMRDIAFRYPADGCYARAHLMVRRMQGRGLAPAKVWSFANGGETLLARTPYAPKGYVEWGYHVAPVLRVRLGNGQQRWYVMDPSMFRGPVPVARWKGAQKRPNARYEPYVTITRVGQAPRDPRGARLPGSGYWPGHDPRDLDQHAVATMRRYKPREGRVAIASLRWQEARGTSGPRTLGWGLFASEPRTRFELAA